MGKILLYMLIILIVSSCGIHSSKSNPTQQKTNFLSNEYHADTVLQLHEKFYPEINKKISLKSAKTSLYSYFRKKGILPQSHVKGDFSESENQLFVSFNTIHEFPSCKGLAIVTYWLAPAYANGHCIQPERAILSRTNSGIHVTNEEFIPSAFLIDSIGKNSIIYISEYECANDTILKRFSLKLK